MAIILVIIRVHLTYLYIYIYIYYGVQNGYHFVPSFGVQNISLCTYLVSMWVNFYFYFFSIFWCCTWNEHLKRDLAICKMPRNSKFLKHVYQQKTTFKKKCHQTKSWVEMWLNLFFQKISFSGICWRNNMWQKYFYFSHLCRILPKIKDW